MRISGIIHDSIVDGPGFRFVIFTQGCNLRCEGCHNTDTWDPGGGYEVSASDLITDMLSNPLTDGLTLSGGEPFLQSEECLEIARAAKESGLSVWAYTGNIVENLLERHDTKEYELLCALDVLVDGAFILPERSLQLKFRGSKNQRIIDVQKTIDAGQAVTLVL